MRMGMEEEKSTCTTGLEDTACDFWGVPVSWLSPTFQRAARRVWAHSHPIPPGNMCQPLGARAHTFCGKMPPWTCHDGLQIGCWEWARHTSVGRSARKPARRSGEGLEGDKREDVHTARHLMETSLVFTECANLEGPGPPHSQGGHWELRQVERGRALTCWKALNVSPAIGTKSTLGITAVNDLQHWALAHPSYRALLLLHPTPGLLPTPRRTPSPVVFHHAHRNARCTSVTVTLLYEILAF